MLDPGIKKLLLTDLRHGPVGDAICVRVMRKWLYDGAQHGLNIQYIGLVLADEKGNSIYAMIPGKHIEKKGDLVQLDKTYFIRKFNVKASKQTYVPFIKPLMIEFGGYTTAAVVQDPPNGLPDYVYNLTAFSDLNPVPPHNTIYVDVLGIIISVGDMQYQRVSSQERVVPIREIIIKNARDDQLKVTLWGDHAKNFCLPGAFTPETAQSIIVLFVGCVPKSINHQTQLNGAYGCRWFFNPNIRDAQPLHDSLSRNPVTVYQPQPTEQDTVEPVQPIVLEHKTLSELRDEDPYDFIKKAGYKCTVTIKDIPEGQKYWYIGCALCKAAQKEETDTFYCSKCKRYDNRPFYKLNFIAEDEIDAAQFFAYDVTARNIIRRDVKAILRQEAKEPGFPKFLKEAVSRKYTFHVTLTEDSFDDVDKKCYLAKAMLVDHDYQTYKTNKLLQLQTSNSTPTVQAVQTLTGQAIEQQTDIIQIPSPHTVMTPPPATQETPSSNIQASSSSHLDKTICTDKDVDKISSTVRRELFPANVAVQDINTPAAQTTSADPVNSVEEEPANTTNPFEMDISDKDTTALLTAPQETKQNSDENSTKQTRNKRRKQSAVSDIES